jgi:hypothetical protein
MTRPRNVAPLPPVASDELALVPSAPESSLTPELARELPVATPPAPWHCVADALVWVQRCGPDVGSVLPAGLRRGTAATTLVGALVRYTDSPVGPYSELLVAVLLRTGLRLALHTPFMVVDSLPSLRAGRASWALPKSLATFEGGPGAADGWGARADGWSVHARSRPHGPRLPLRAALHGVQVRPDQALGHYRAAISGSARPCHVEVDVTARQSLSRWMPPGRHLGLRWSSASLVLSAPVAGAA